jgi:hypothetical protein
MGVKLRMLVLLSGAVGSWFVTRHYFGQPQGALGNLLVCWGWGWVVGRPGKAADTRGNQISSVNCGEDSESRDSGCAESAKT